MPEGEIVDSRLNLEVKAPNLCGSGLFVFEFPRHPPDNNVSLFFS